MESASALAPTSSRLAGMTVSKVSKSQMMVAYVRFRIREWCDEHPRKGAELARQLGVTSQHISQVRLRDEGMVGADLLDAFATHYFKGSTDALRDAAETWWNNRPPALPTEPRVVRDERYPNRAIAAAFARQAGISEEAIAAVESMVLHSREDPTPLDWLDQMKLKQTEMRMLRPLPSATLRDVQEAERDHVVAPWKKKKR